TETLDSGCADYIPFFKKLFERLKVRTFLEFGIGYRTKYFLDHTSKVISVEFITNGHNPKQMREYVNLYRNITNWTPIAFFSGYEGDMSWAPYKYMGSENVYKADSYQCANHRSYASINGFYKDELNSFISNLFKAYKATVSFVQPPIYLRGDLVQLLFDKSQIIIAQHTGIRYIGLKDDLYGYSRVVTPDNYEEIYLPNAGITVWMIKNDLTQELIAETKKYANSIY
ncbi:MAG TPA: hypothetical protein VLE96_01615, partial [Chlamydiales bacterium]|nr:hypothetical protein [Chlamydiales bacterium]